MAAAMRGSCVSSAKWPASSTCSAHDCSLVFYDTARNATRRWCSMAACGDRQKVARHRARDGKH